MSAMPLEVDKVDWIEAAVDQIALLARTHQSFTADDLRPLICEPHHSGAWGAAFRTASQRRIITRLDSRPSRTKSRNGGDLKVWAGTEKARTE